MTKFLTSWLQTLLSGGSHAKFRSKHIFIRHHLHFSSDCRCVWTSSFRWWFVDNRLLYWSTCGATYQPQIQVQSVTGTGSQTLYSGQLNTCVSGLAIDVTSMYSKKHIAGCNTTPSLLAESHGCANSSSTISKFGFFMQPKKVHCLYVCLSVSLSLSLEYRLLKQLSVMFALLRRSDSVFHNAELNSVLD